MACTQNSSTQPSTNTQTIPAAIQANLLQQAELLTDLAAELREEAKRTPAISNHLTDHADHVLDIAQNLVMLSDGQETCRLPLRIPHTRAELVVEEEEEEDDDEGGNDEDVPALNIGGM